MNEKHETMHADPAVAKPAGNYGRSPHVESGAKKGEKLPGKLSGWIFDKHRTKAMPFDHKAIGLSVWKRSGVVVISALENAHAPDGSLDVIPQWHLSVSHSGARASDEVVRQTLASFDMTGTEEDNHHPGTARHFWMPVDPRRRVECECKSDETITVEPDGYTWSHDPEQECPWCTMIKIGKTDIVCPNHPGAIAAAPGEFRVVDRG